MISARKLVTSLFLVAFLLMQGCSKKRVALPPKSQAPTIAASLPDSIPLEEEPEPQPQVAETQPPPPPPTTKPKKPPRNAKKTNPAPNPTAVNNNAQNGKANQTVASVRPPANPADTPPQTVIAAAIPSAQLTQQKEDTTRMVDSTENALKGLTRSLSDDEKSMKSQIQSYLQQSRKATSDGDFERAFNLAKKAQLLADALLKK